MTWRCQCRYQTLVPLHNKHHAKLFNRGIQRFWQATPGLTLILVLVGSLHSLHSSETPIQTCKRAHTDIKSGLEHVVIECVCGGGGGGIIFFFFNKVLQHQFSFHSSFWYPEHFMLKEQNILCINIYCSIVLERKTNVTLFVWSKLKTRTSEHDLAWVRIFLTSITLTLICLNQIQASCAQSAKPYIKHSLQGFNFFSSPPPQRKKKIPMPFNKVFNELLLLK